MCLWQDEEDEDGEFDEEYDEGFSSEDEEIGDGWVGVDGERVMEGVRKRRAGRGEVPYEDRWDVDRDQLAKSRVNHGHSDVPQQPRQADNYPASAHNFPTSCTNSHGLGKRDAPVQLEPNGYHCVFRSNYPSLVTTRHHFSISSPDWQT